MTSKIGFLRRIGAGERFAALREEFNRLAENLIARLIETLTAALPVLAGRFLSALPSVIPAVLVTVISGFYFCTDGERIGRALVSLLPRSVRSRFPDWRSRMKRFSWRYVKAYLLLLLITFSVLFPAFLILRLDYAFLLALLISVVDLLPILGVGTVLVPWAIVMLLSHRFYLGFGLLIVYAIVTLLRQIMEPRLLGHTLGLHPLLALASGYVGLRVLGMTGLLIGPILAMLLKPCISQIRAFYAQNEDAG